MGEQRWAEVDGYLTELFGGADPALAAAQEAGRAAGMPDISVSAEQGRLLRVLARAVHARAILEVGTLAGFSTIWLARSLPPGGRLISLEAVPLHAEVARSNLARAGLADVAEVRLGPAAESMAELDATGAGPFDLVFIDADKPGYPEYLSWALKLTRPGSLIVADNVVRGGALADLDNTEPNVAGVRQYLELVAAEPRLTATALQTVGAKGWDGLSIAVVEAG
ncbi:MAG TPA: O-methyltransferase [Mycobacteriales bacterium]|nr:O-methyltransferase [Mycobacteriales bacterium]